MSTSATPSSAPAVRPGARTAPGPVSTADGTRETDRGADGKALFPEGPAARPYPGAHDERRVRTFHPRRGRLTGAQHDAIVRLWPRWGLDIDGTPLDLDALFGGGGLPVVLEIGFGMGDATALMAAAEPGTGILAVDVHTPGQGGLLRLAERAGLSNLRVGNGDAVVLLRDMLPPASLAGLRVFFPDPWPKARHHKRRLIQPEFVRLAVSRLAPGAIFHCATDWSPYAEQMLDVLTAAPGLRNLHPGYAPRPDFRPVTKFERLGLAKGHTVHDLLFTRTGSGPPPGR